VEQVMVRGIRGAITVEENCSDEIIQATAELVEEMVRANDVKVEDVAAVFFSLTPDLNAAFPAKAVRSLGWKNVPLFCTTEIDVPGAVSQCIRVMILANTLKGQEEIKHLYLGEARKLREDLQDTW